MHYLIDGHNLIAQLPDIALDDPNDEAKLVLRLKSWTAAGRKRQVTVVFDGGLSGGTWRYMSRGKIKALFATEGQTADALLISRIQQIKDPSAHTVVTSDREILSAARKRRMPFITSEAFSQQLQKIVVDQEMIEIPDPSIADEPLLSDTEIDEWMAIFESEPNPRRPADSSTGDFIDEEDRGEELTLTPEPAMEEEPTTLKSGNRKLSSDEVDEWLALFQDDGEN